MNTETFHPPRLDEMEHEMSREILDACGVDINQCLECGKCSGGCPNGHLFDFTPRKVLQLIRMGRENTLLSLEALWLCLSCHICLDRCPSSIDMPRVLDYLREKAQKKGVHATRPRVEQFLKAMLRSIEGRGRIAEVPLMLQFALASRSFPRDDIVLGLKMLLRGKFRLFTPRVKQIGDIRKIFHETR